MLENQKESLYYEKEELEEELKVYQDIKNHSKCSKEESKKFLMNSCSIILVFSLSPFFYGITYDFWPLTIMGLFTVIFSFSLYLISKNNNQNN